MERLERALETAREEVGTAEASSMSQDGRHRDRDERRTA
jgi:hypothetical protein